MSIAEKLADLEGELKVLVDTLDGTKSDAATNSQKISALETDSKLHGQLIQQVLVKTNNHKAKYPSLAEGVAGGSSNQPLQMTGGTNRDGAPDGNDNDQCERKQEADRESQPIPVSPRIDSTTQQLHGTFVIPADQRRIDSTTRQLHGTFVIPADQRRIDSTTQQLHGTFVIPADQRRIDSTTQQLRDTFVIPADQRRIDSTTQQLRGTFVIPAAQRRIDSTTQQLRGTFVIPADQRRIESTTQQLRDTFVIPADQRRIDSTTQQLRDTFVIPADQRRKQKKQLQREKRSKQPRNTRTRGTIAGQGIDAAGVTMVPPPDRDFFICRVHKSDGVSEVGEYITRKGVKFRKLTKASNNNAKMNSFKLTISVNDINKVKDPLLCPKGWNVRRW